MVDPVRASRNARIRYGHPRNDSRGEHHHRRDRNDSSWTKLSPHKRALRSCCGNRDICDPSCAYRKCHLRMAFSSPTKTGRAYRAGERGFWEVRPFARLSTINAVTGKVDSRQKHLSGNATYREL